MKILTNVTLLFLTAHGRALFSAGPDWTRLGHTRPKCHSQEFARHDSECPFTFACLAEEVGERERWGLVNFEFGIRSLTTRLSACLGFRSGGRRSSARTAPVSCCQRCLKRVWVTLEVRSHVLLPYLCMLPLSPPACTHGVLMGVASARLYLS